MTLLFLTLLCFVDVVIKDLEPGTHYLKIVVTSDSVKATTLPSTSISTRSTFANQVQQLVANVPEHKNKANVQKALAASYLALSKQKLPLAELMRTRKEAHKLWTKQFDCEKEWEQFDRDLVALLNRHDPEGKQLDQVAAGLSDGQFLTPEFIEAVTNVLLGIINKQPLAALLLRVMGLFK